MFFGSCEGGGGLMFKPFIDINLEFRNLRLLFEDRCAKSLVKIYIFCWWALSLHRNCPINESGFLMQIGDMGQNCNIDKQRFRGIRKFTFYIIRTEFHIKTPTFKPWFPNWPNLSWKSGFIYGWWATYRLSCEESWISILFSVSRALRACMVH